MLKTVSKFIQLFFLLFLGVGAFHVYGQVYPVQVTTQIVPPYTPYLSDYTAPGSQRMMMNFVLRDPTLPEYRCKLRITIEGVGITIRTKASYVPEALVLPGGGVPTLLYGEDLLEYFKPDNLDFAGITRNQYEKGAKLPEGIYRFTVEVLDYNRNTVVSNKGTATAWVILNDPPLLNLPRKDTKVQILDPTNIPFTWTPRHTGSPNAAFTTEYVFRLVEVWPITRNPYDAFLSQPVLYEVTSNVPQIIYDMAAPALLPGRKYAWQVQARDVEGRDLFKNDGRSEVYLFQFGDALGIPEALTLQSSTSSALTVRWDQPAAGSDAVTYRTRYRPHNNRTHDNWYEGTTNDQWKAISSLQPNTEYEVQVRAEQTMQTSDYSATGVFKTAVAGASDFACKSDVQPPPAPASTTPTFPLNVNDTIHAGGYDVLVRGLTASGKTYTGEGFAMVPWLHGAKVRVTFKDIAVNSQFWLTSGEIKSVWNADSKFLINVPSKDNPANTPNTGDIPVTVVATDSVVKIKDAAIATVTKDPDGNIVVSTTDGNTTVLEKGKSYSIVDDIGNGYVVDKEGNITKTTAEQALAAGERGNRDYNIAMRFDKSVNTKFGFDAKKYEPLNSYYQQLNEGDYVAWKAVTSSEADEVNAIITGSLDQKKLKFEISGVPVTPGNGTGGALPLSVRGKAEGSVEELLATYPSTDTTKSEVVGKLNLISYDKISRNVVIVPVNDVRLPGGVSAETIQTDLNKIYRQAVSEWKVSMATQPLSVTLSETFDDGEAGLLSNYTADMKTVINAYGRLQDNTYYLFLVKNPRSGASKQGFMPRSKQAGFIFVSSLNASNISAAMAHELGHGAFNLEHTFDEFPGLTQTDNVMDYPNGTALYKYQWDHVHNPQRVVPLFEDDEEGASIAVASISCVNQEILGKFSGNVFYDPSGAVIDLGTAVPYGFYSQNEEDVYLRGRLAAFKLNGKLYRTYYYSKDLSFAGYAPADAKYSTVAEFNKLRYNPAKGNVANVQLLEIGIGANARYRILKASTEIGTGTIADCACKDIPTTKGGGPDGGGATGIPGGLAGGFYRHYEPTAGIDKDALLRVANLISKMGDDFYKKYMPDAEKLPLTNENLAAMEESLQQFIDAQNAVFGEVSFSAFEKIWKFLTMCYDDYKKQLDDETHDIVPRCIWKDQTVTAFYSPVDLAFNAGIVDGAWEFVMGVKDLLNFLDCWAPISPTLRFWFDDSCGQTRKKTKEFFTAMGSIITDGNKFSAVSGSVSNQFTSYLSSLNGISPDNRHEQGKLAFNIASLFFGVGEANAALKGANLAEKTAVIMEKVAAVMAKIKIPSIVKLVPKKALIALTLTVGTFTTELATAAPAAGTAIEYVINFSDDAIRTVKVVEGAAEATAITARAAEAAAQEAVVLARTAEAVGAAEQGAVRVIGQMEVTFNGTLRTIETADFVVVGSQIGTEFNAISAVSKETAAVFIVVGTAAGKAPKDPAKAPCPVCAERTQNDEALCAMLEGIIAKSTNRETTTAAIEKLCAAPITSLTPAEFKAIAARLTAFNGDAIAEISADIVTSREPGADLSANYQRLTAGLVDTWKFLRDNHAKKAVNARIYFVGLQRFQRLTRDVQTQLVKFTDDNDPAKSSLRKAMNDLSDDMIEFLNGNGHALFANGFVGHHDDPKWDVRDYDVLREALLDIPVTDAVRAKVIEYLNRSSKIGRQQDYYDQGTEFEERMRDALGNPGSSAYLGLQRVVPDLAEREIFYHAYLCLNGGPTCVKEREYFIADFILVKDIFDNTGQKIRTDVIVVDSKLSSGTGFTRNQETARGMDRYYVRLPGTRVTGPAQTSPLGVGGFISRNKIMVDNVLGFEYNFIKIYSDGNLNFGNARQETR